MSGEVVTKHDTPLTIVPIVSPATNDPSTSGRIKNLACGGTIQHRQLMPVDGIYAVHPRWARQGWKLLEDFYLEESNPEGWKKYQRYIDAWRRNLIKVAFPQEDLPKAVRERQTCGVASEVASEFRVKPTTGKIEGA